MAPRPGDNWDNKRIGANGVPLKTEHGWLLFYHGYNQDHVYRHSVALLDLDDPTKVINRPAGFIFEPDETWRSRATCRMRCLAARTSSWAKTCGCTTPGDRVIGLATAPLSDVIEYARNG